MENQHTLISGYRDLTQAEIDLMNEIKIKQVGLNTLVQTVADFVKEQAEGDEDVDLLNKMAETYRWQAIAKTALEQGMMALTRAVARPVDAVASDG